jgi:hypothetical protein
MWKELIQRFAPDAQFRPPVRTAALAKAETELGCALPGELRELLKETNGVTAGYSVLVRPLDEIVDGNRTLRTNPEFRSLYMSFDQLLFFSDDGGGDQFGYRILPDADLGPEIYLWNHENDSRSWAASGLARFLESRLTGVI